MVMPIVKPDAAASAALSVALDLVEKLVSKGVLGKQEMVDSMLAIADAKMAKAKLYGNETESDAAALLADTANRLDERLKSS